MTKAALARDREHILARTAGLWDDLRGERIFVTGGTGFVGTWLVEGFVAANAALHLGARIVLLSRNPSRFRARAPHLAGDSAVELIHGDAVDFAGPDGRFPFVVHAATERSHPADAQRPLSIFDRDLLATRRVLEFGQQRGLRRLLFTSSGAVYGVQPPDLAHVPETYAGSPDPTDVDAVYGHSKRTSEFACVAYARVFGFSAVIARLFAFVGPHLPLDNGYAVGNFLRDVLEGRPIRIAGDGTPLRSYLYAADLSIWLWTLLLRGTAGRAYNVGSDEQMSIGMLAERIASTLAPGTTIETARVPNPEARPSRYVPATARATDELGLRRWIELDDALHRTYDYHCAFRKMTASP